MNIRFGRSLSRLLITSLAGLAVGCGDGDNGTAANPAGTIALDSAKCAALLGTTLGDGSPERGRGVVEGATWSAAQVDADPSKSTPDHCRVTGTLNPRSNGFDGSEDVAALAGNATYGIRFELRLPASWNQKFYFQAYGGTEGVVLPALGMLAGGAGFKDNALLRGYSVVTTDTGHAVLAGINGAYRYGYDPQARLEYAYLATSIVTHAARSVMQQAYQQPPARSYYLGGSGGGRQGMKATQKFPDLFDGVVSVVPAMRVPRASVANMVMVQELASISGFGVDGVTKDIATAFTQAQLNRAASEILQQCDALDGIRDGMVFSPSRCSFDPQVLACPATNAPADCMTPAQVGVFRRLHDGIPQYAGWYYDPGLATGWPSHRLGTINTVAGAPNNATISTLMAGFLAYDAVTPPLANPTANLYQYMLTGDPLAETAKLSATSSRFPISTTELIDADSPDLDRFAARRGRLLIVHGLADPYFSAADTRRYVDQVISRYGADRAKDIVRLFLVPGMNHGRGGPTTDVADLLGVLDSWVESGASPDMYEAKVLPENAALPAAWSRSRSRKICAYPKEAFYVGGDGETAAAFECR